jgi:hypothetical protein
MWAHYLPPLQPPKGSEPQAPRTPWMRRAAQAYPDLVRHLLRSQVDLDIIDEEAIISGEMCDGALHVAGEADRAVVLPPIDALALDTAQALARFCDAGGVLLSVGPLPTMAGSAADAQALQDLFSTLFAEDGAGQVVALEQLPAALRARVPPDLSLGQDNADVLYTHRRLEGRDLYFIINNAAAGTTIRPVLRESGPYTLYRPLTGGVEEVGSSLQIDLAAYEGVFVVAKSRN